MIGTLDSKVPDGPMADKWTNHKFDMKLVNPANKRKFEVIVVGTGLAGASAAATMGELGYRVKAFTYNDTPRRAHSIAAQGGINSAKNYRGTTATRVFRLFYDTVKGGDYRSTRGERPPAGRGVGEHHRSVRGPGRPLRSRVRRPARQPFLRRRPGSREPSTREDRPASSCCSAPTRP